MMRIEIGDDRAGLGTKFAAEGVRIGFEREKISVGAENFVFVDGAFADFGEEKFPDAGRASRTHGMDATVPAVHIAYDADTFCCRGPDGEVGSGDASDGVEMRAEFFVSVEMTAFADEMQIEIGEEKRESVRIENFEGLIGVGAALNFVTARLGGGRLIGRPDGFEEAFGTEFDGVGNFGGRDDWILEDDAGFLGPGNEEANCPAFGYGMGAEDAEGIGVRSGKKRIGAGVEIGKRRLFCGGSCGA